MRVDSLYTPYGDMQVRQPAVADGAGIAVCWRSFHHGCKRCTHVFIMCPANPASASSPAFRAVQVSSISLRTSPSSLLWGIGFSSLVNCQAIGGRFSSQNELALFKLQQKENLEISHLLSPSPSLLLIQLIPHFVSGSQLAPAKVDAFAQRRMMWRALIAQQAEGEPVMGRVLNQVGSRQDSST